MCLSLAASWAFKFYAYLMKNYKDKHIYLFFPTLCSEMLWARMIRSIRVRFERIETVWVDHMVRLSLKEPFHFPENGISLMKLYQRAHKTEYPPSGNFHTPAINMSYAAQKRERERTISTWAVVTKSLRNSIYTKFAILIYLAFFSPIWVFRTKYGTRTRFLANQRGKTRKMRRRWIPNSPPSSQYNIVTPS